MLPSQLQRMPVVPILFLLLNHVRNYSLDRRPLNCRWSLNSSLSVVIFLDREALLKIISLLLLLIVTY